MSCEQTGQLPPLLADGSLPAWTAPCGLIAPFQQVHHEHYQPTCQVSILTFTHSGESLRSQGGIVWPEVSAEDLIWWEGTALWECIQPCVFQSHLTCMRIYFCQKYWNLSL